MTAATKVAFLVQRIGPYHHARLSAFSAAHTGPVCAIEFRADEGVYAWESVKGGASYERRKTGGGGIVENLKALGPDVVVCVGYFDPEIHRAISWASGRGVPLVVCSDSTREDEPRIWAKEAFKSRVAAAFDTALVAGSRSALYLESLGIGPERQFRPWDVVDNSHFGRGADDARLNSSTRARLGLPDSYFLCVARFVDKKNLVGLLGSYAEYVRRARVRAWSLLLAGGGPLDAELRQEARRLGLEHLVQFRGLVGYSDLPAYYGLAGALVLPSVSEQWGLVVNEAFASGTPAIVSSRCGCVDDLLDAGENGLSFDPADSGSLTDALAGFAETEGSMRVAMGRRAREKISTYTPAAFAAGIEAAVAGALARGKPAGWDTRILVKIMARRTSPTR